MIISLVLLLYLLLWIPSVQQKIKDIALTELMKITGNKMRIGEFSFRPFNQLKINDAYIEDLKGDTLLYVHKLSAGFDLMQLLNNRLLIQSVSMDHFVAHIEKDSVNASFNFQFFIDAFASKDTISKEPSKLVIEIEDVKLTNGRLTYDIISEQQLSEGMFDSNHIRLDSLNTEIRLNSINVQKLDVALKSLAFKEKSGFEVKNLKTVVRSDEKRLFIDKLELQLPFSSLLLSAIQLDYTGLELAELTKGASYSMAIGPIVLWPSDLKPFYLPLGNISDSLHIEGSLSGKFPEINLSKLQANLGNYLSISTSIQIQDFNNWQSTPLEINIDKLNINQQGINTILGFSASGNSKLSASQFPIEPISLAGKISGSLPSLSILLNAENETAKLNVEGEAGYLYPEGKIHCDMKLDVDRFTYNYYTYRNIEAHAIYLNDSVNLNLISRDPNVPIQLSASGNLRPSVERINLDARLNHLRLDTTHWLKNYPGADLYTHLTVSVKGFNPEKMEASVLIDSLSFRSDSIDFEQNQMKIDYIASDKNQKKMSLKAEIFDLEVNGNFTLRTIATSFEQTLSEYLPNLFPKKGKRLESGDQLEFNLNIRNTEQLSQLLKLPFSITKPAILKGSYLNAADNLTLMADLPEIRFNAILLTNSSLYLQTDTIHKKMNLTAKSSQFKDKDSLQFGMNAETIEKGISFSANAKNHSPQLDLEGNISADVHFEPGLKKSGIPDLTVNLKPSTISVNNQIFNLKESMITLLMSEKKYMIENFALTHSDSEYIKVNGRISDNPEDTLSVSLSQLQLKTLMDAARLNLNIQGVANGNIIINHLLTSPLIITKGFSIQDITLEGRKIGTLNLVSGWSEDGRGISFKAGLHREGVNDSQVSGHIVPAKDFMDVDIDIQSVPVDWLAPFTTGTLFGLQGELGMKMKATGKMNKPDLNGFIYLKNANIGVTMLNTQYKISDTIAVKPNLISINNFRITDENNQTATLEGKITHTNFSDINPDLTLNLNNFLVLNNPNQTDSLFFGNLRIKGSVKATAKDKDIQVDAKISNSDNSSITINMPQSTNEAQRYSSITFVSNLEGDSIVEDEPSVVLPEPAKVSLPIKLNVSLAINPELKLGAIINPATRDAANVSGSGNIDFSYNLNNADMNLFGTYTVRTGQCTLSLKNITKKTFTIQEGGTVTFKGDPMATAFDVTAVYTTRADLSTLDPNFAELMNSSKTTVNALLNLTGDLNKINLEYDITYPNEKEDIKRKADGLMYTDEIKIKQIAYLLAFNTFYPVNSSTSKSTGTNLWTSLASSSLTSQLNNMLSGVLNENWSIGTELHASDNSLSDMEMDVNVSTRLFDDRMTISSNLGYRTNTSAGNTTNFTGDFDVQLKLTNTGNIILKIYNLTNNQYWEKAKTTQGVGVIYKKETRTFKNLFRRTKR